MKKNHFLILISFIFLLIAPEILAVGEPCPGGNDDCVEWEICVGGTCQSCAAVGITCDMTYACCKEYGVCTCAGCEYECFGCPDHCQPYDCHRIEHDTSPWCASGCGADPECDSLSPGDDCGEGNVCDTNCKCGANGNDDHDANGEEDCPCSSGICSEEKKGGLVPCGKTCDDPDTPVNECCPCTLCHLFVLFKKVVDFATTYIAIPLAVVMLTIGGIIMVTATGNPGQISQGKGVIRAVVIGLLLVFAAWLIVNTIVTLLTTLEHPLRAWYEIECPLNP